MKFYIFMLGFSLSSLLWGSYCLWREWPGREVHIYRGHGGGGGGACDVSKEYCQKLIVERGGGHGSAPARVWGPWQKNSNGDRFRRSTDGLASEWK